MELSLPGLFLCIILTSVLIEIKMLVSWCWLAVDRLVPAAVGFVDGMV